MIFIPVGLQVPEHDLLVAGGCFGSSYPPQAGRQEASRRAPVAAFSVMPLIRDTIVFPLPSSSLAYFHQSLITSFNDPTN